MKVADLTGTLAIPVDVEFHNDEGIYLCTVRSSQCIFKEFDVIRWWPEEKEKIVVFVAPPSK